MKPESEYLLSHRCHDYARLVARWKKVSEVSGLMMEKYGEASGFDCFYLKAPKLEATGGLYISTGIHGDEVGASEGLIFWAEKHLDELVELPILLLPCLNPWGVINNTRTDEDGKDLNRGWEKPSTPAIKEVVRLIDAYRFDVALTLHEDYDGQGIYLYEPAGDPPYWGEQFIGSVDGVIALDRRSEIDEMAAQCGVIRKNVEDIELDTLPEAVYLQMKHANRTFTFETPSEFGLDVRVAAQVRLIEKAVELGGFGTERRPLA